MAGTTRQGRSSGFSDAGWQSAMEAKRTAPMAPLLDQRLDLEEGGQGAAIVRHKQRHSGPTAGVDHRQALAVVVRHRLFDVNRFAGSGDLGRVMSVGVRGRCDIDRIDIRVADECVGLVVPSGYAVALGIVAGLVRVAAHDRYQLGIAGLVQGRAALNFGDVAAANDAPANCSHETFS